MNPMLFGIIAGVVFGAVDMALMLPIDFLTSERRFWVPF